MTIDWEAEMREVRSRATAAARHGERTLGGMAEALKVLQVQDKRLTEMNKVMKAMETRLGSLEAALQAAQALQMDNRAGQPSRSSVALWSGAALAFVAVILSGVFLWN